jgi:hypothetical protein
MIAVVSSTIKPQIKNGKAVSLFSFEERLEQTKLTLVRLHEHGFEQVFLVDNSPQLNQPQLAELLRDFPDVKVFHLQQYQFLNKGVNELLMMLYLIQYLPADNPIFKISGRYCPSVEFRKPDFADFAFKPYHYHKKNGIVSTRGYWIKNAQIFERFLLSCLDELFAYPERVVGIKSLLRLLFVEKNVIGNPLNISIEFAAANVLKAGKYKVQLLDSMGIEGLIAGAGTYEKITE